MPFIFYLISQTIYATENFIHACGCALEGRKFYQRSRDDQGQGLQRQQLHLGRFSSCEKIMHFLSSKESESRRLCVARLATTPVLIWRKYSERVASRFATRKVSPPKTSSAEGKGRSGEKFCRSITGRSRPAKGVWGIPTLTKQQLTFNHR